jgi:S-adenosylmethionine hydrolase
VPSQISGTVVEISPDGDLITDITLERLRGVPRDERVTVRCDEHETQGIFEAGHSEPPSTFLALMNARGALELVIVGDSAAIMLGIRRGEAVTVIW